jgi:hypothetical protein
MRDERRPDECPARAYVRQACYRCTLPHCRGEECAGLQDMVKPLCWALWHRTNTITTLVRKIIAIHKPNTFHIGGYWW